MANTFSPFGFLQYQGGAGGAPTFAQSVRRISPSYSTAIYYGDPVIPATSSATGYIVAAAAQGANSTSTVVAGIFVGCKYLSISQKRIAWSRYWPGSDANTGYDVEAYVIDDPASRFQAQANGAAFFSTSATANWTGGIISSLPIGQYVTFNMGTGNANTGTSGAYVNAAATTVTSPFVIVDYVFGPPGANGTDPSTNYPTVVVGFNNEVWRTNGAGPTGIS